MCKRIMMVDDSATIRQTVSMTLRNAGYEVIEACDGIEALYQLERESIDMLITDLNMPRLDGVGLIANVRRGSGNRFLPIVMLTTESDETQKRSGKRAGASAWLVKPFNPDQLLGLVNTVLA
jgi:two-component system chemotaxis response regulator CheY